MLSVMGDGTRKWFTSADDVFADAVRSARERCGLTQLSLAMKMSERGFDFHQQTVYKIEKRDRKVTVSEAKAISEIVGVSLDELVEEDPNSLDSVVREMDRHFRAFRRQLEIAYEAAKDAILSQAELEHFINQLRKHPDVTEAEKAALDSPLSQLQTFADFAGFADYMRAYEALEKATQGEIVSPSILKKA